MGDRKPPDTETREELDELLTEVVELLRRVEEYLYDRRHEERVSVTGHPGWSND